jgi:hypothetical protein
MARGNFIPLLIYLLISLSLYKKILYVVSEPILGHICLALSYLFFQ